MQNLDILSLNQVRFIGIVVAWRVLNWSKSTMDRSWFTSLWSSISIISAITSFSILFTCFIYLLIELVIRCFVVIVVECVIFDCSKMSWVLSSTSHSTSSYSSNMSRSTIVAILSFYRFSNRAIKIHYKILILVDCVFIRRFRGFNLSIVSSCLSSSLECYSFLICSCILLNCVVVNRVSTYFSWIYIRTYKFIYNFSTLL